MENEKNEMIIVSDEGQNLIADLTQTRTTMLCTLKADTLEEKAIKFKAMNNPEHRLADCINMTINAKDIFCEVVQLTNEETGEITNCPRIVLIDDEGVGYQAVSKGVYNALCKLISVFGTPTWENPVPITVKSITKGQNRILTFDIATTCKKK